MSHCVFAFFYCPSKHFFLCHCEIVARLLLLWIVSGLLNNWLLLYPVRLCQILFCLHAFCQCSCKSFVLSTLYILICRVLASSYTRFCLFYILSNLIFLSQTCRHRGLKLWVFIRKLLVHSKITTRLYTWEALVHLLSLVRLTGRAEHRVETCCN